MIFAKEVNNFYILITYYKDQNFIFKKKVIL